MDYFVTWEMGVEDAADPVDAARQALAVQRDPGSIATVFKVADEHGNVTTVDMEDHR